jgi:hypothetical protein
VGTQWANNATNLGLYSNGVSICTGRDKCCPHSRTHMSAARVLQIGAANDRYATWDVESLVPELCTLFCWTVEAVPLSKAQPVVIHHLGKVIGTGTVPCCTSLPSTAWCEVCSPLCCSSLERQWMCQFGHSTLAFFSRFTSIRHFGSCWMFTDRRSASNMRGVFGWSRAENTFRWETLFPGVYPEDVCSITKTENTKQVSCFVTVCGFPVKVYCCVYFAVSQEVLLGCLCVFTLWW